MSRHDDEPSLTDIPSIVPERDDRVAPPRGKAAPRSRPEQPAVDEEIYEDEPPRRGGGAGLWLLALLVVGLAGWAGFLHMQLSQSQAVLASYQGRVADLEQRLSVTDESVNQSSVAMQVKIKELDGEIRKLWDNVWKKQQETLTAHQGQLATLDKSVKAAQGEVAKISKDFTAQQKTVAGMRSQLEKAGKTEATVELSKRRLDEQQVALESVTERLSRIASEQEKLGQRISTNEEWVQSINNFRKQTNRELVNLKSQVAPVPGGQPQPLQ